MSLLLAWLDEWRSKSPLNGGCSGRLASYQSGILFVFGEGVYSQWLCVHTTSGGVPEVGELITLAPSACVCVHIVYSVWPLLLPGPVLINFACINLVLSRAKSKNGGTVLRQRLQEIGVMLPSGRRKQTDLSLLTSLVESKYCIESKCQLRMASCKQFRLLGSCQVFSTSLQVWYAIHSIWQ